MMRFLRSQSQTVLVIVLGVIGLGFLFYGSSGNLLTSTNAHVSNDFGRINGEDLSVSDLYDAVHDVRNTLIISGNSEHATPAIIADQAWAQLLLLHEADRLHIEVSTKEMVDYIRSQQIFQKDGVYSPDAYQKAMAQLQMRLRISPDAGADPLATTKATFENIMRNNLRTNAVSSALFSTIRTPAKDISDQYDKFSGPTTVTVVTFDPKTFIDSAKVTDEEVAAEYKAHPENPAYRSKEKRKVDYVLFLLPPDQAKLPAAQKTAAIEALGEKALQFVLAFQPDPSATPGAPFQAPDFQTEAKKRGLNPATTDFFTADSTPANVPPSPAFNNTAFSLTKDNTVSKVVELDNGVAVEHLVEIQASDLLPLAQVTPDITKQLRETKGQQAAQVQSQIVAAALKAAVAKGTDFKVAATAMNLKVETVPAFVPMQAAQTAGRTQGLAYVSTTLTPGQVSDPIPSQTDNTTLIVHLDSRAKPDAAGLAAFETRYRTEADQQLRGLVYHDWVQWQSTQPGTHKPPNLELYGSIE